MKSIICGVLACLACATACVPSGDAKKPEVTQLQLREFQTRNYDVTDLRLVMKSVLNVLQDDNYIVKNVALDLGFLTATKESDVETRTDRFMAELGNGSNARWLKHEIIESTVNVSEFGKSIRVRVNFLTKLLDNRGSVVTIRQITDEKFYQTFFSKVDKGIFIQEQNI